MSQPADERLKANTRYIDALREHWRLVAALVVVAVCSAVVYSALAPKRYQASADILVTPISSTDNSLVGLDLVRESADPTSSSVLTEARLVKTPGVAAAVRARLHLGMSQRALLDAISVEAVSQANVLSIVRQDDEAATD